jgi:hypothetical protein
MYRSPSSIAYDILNGINFSANVSSMFAYLSYFPPPPPVIPCPPPRRPWTCSARSLSSSSCLVSDDRNPPSLRSYIPLNNNNQSSLFSNTSNISKISHQGFKSSSISESISYFFQNQLTFILLLIIFLSIFVFVILLLLLFLYIQRHRQSQLTSNSHREINNNIELNSNNNNNNNNNNKNKKFYYHLIPYRQKHERRVTLRNSTEENNSLRLSNHDSPVLEVIRLSKSSGIHRNNNEEQEEAL